jgi:hypothetical protein
VRSRAPLKCGAHVGVERVGRQQRELARASFFAMTTTGSSYSAIAVTVAACVLAGVAAEAEPRSCSGPIQKDLKFNCSDRPNDTPGSPSGARRADPRPSPHVRALAALL